jgi:hypothetical protein
LLKEQVSSFDYLLKENVMVFKCLEYNRVISVIVNVLRGILSHNPTASMFNIMLTARLLVDLIKLWVIIFSSNRERGLLTYNDACKI